MERSTGDEREDELQTAQELMLPSVQSGMEISIPPVSLEGRVLESSRGQFHTGPPRAKHPETHTQS